MANVHAASKLHMNYTFKLYQPRKRAFSQFLSLIDTEQGISANWSTGGILRLAV